MDGGYDLLDVSRVTRGLIELEKAPVDMRNIGSEAVEKVNPLILARRHHLALHLSPEAVTVMGDNKRLVQILANLLHNAAKYTHEGGNIVLKMHVLDHNVRIDIEDDGIGMDPQLAAHVFDLFSQAKRTPDRSSGGLGLGLALVKSLVQLHGGSVACSSEGIGKGSTFLVCLPLWAAAAESVLQTNAGEHLAPSGKALRVMVVDDNTDAAHMLGLLLEAFGYQVMIEYGARQALERSRVEPPNVYVLDIGLPEIDGNELALRLKSQSESARATLIALTGYGQRYDREQALAAGFSYYFVKPVDTAKLLTVLDQINLRLSNLGGNRKVGYVSTGALQLLLATHAYRGQLFLRRAIDCPDSGCTELQSGRVESFYDWLLWVAKRGSSQEELLSERIGRNEQPSIAGHADARFHIAIPTSANTAYLMT